MAEFNDAKKRLKACGWGGLESELLEARRPSEEDEWWTYAERKDPEGRLSLWGFTSEAEALADLVARVEAMEAKP